MASYLYINCNSILTSRQQISLFLGFFSAKSTFYSSPYKSLAFHFLVDIENILQRFHYNFFSRLQFKRLEISLNSFLCLCLPELICQSECKYCADNYEVLNERMMGSCRIPIVRHGSQSPIWKVVKEIKYELWLLW